MFGTRRGHSGTQGGVGGDQRAQANDRRDLMSPGTTLMLILVFGSAAIGFSLVVLKTWLLEHRLPRVAGGWAACTTAILLTGLLAAHHSAPDRGPGDANSPWVPQYRTAWYRSARYVTPEQRRVDRMHRQFGPALEMYRQTHGKYPPTLEDVGIATPLTHYGPLYYYSSGSRRDPWYLISFGDIERHHFSADWDSRTQEWNVVKLDF
jgi:hypothetical protein